MMQTIANERYHRHPLREGEIALIKPAEVSIQKRRNWNQLEKKGRGKVGTLSTDRFLLDLPDDIDGVVVNDAARYLRLTNTGFETRSCESQSFHDEFDGKLLVHLKAC